MIKKDYKLTNNHYLKSSNEMTEIFKDLPEALENNYNLPADVILDQFLLNQYFQTSSSIQIDINEDLKRFIKKC